jgi:hypothetical protein
MRDRIEERAAKPPLNPSVHYSNHILIVVYVVSLQRGLHCILQMHGNIKFRMQCHRAFAKCDGIYSAKN